MPKMMVVACAVSACSFAMVEPVHPPASGHAPACDVDPTLPIAIDITLAVVAGFASAAGFGNVASTDGGAQIGFVGLGVGGAAATVGFAAGAVVGHRRGVACRALMLDYASGR